MNETMNAPTERDVKKLFALSLNQCAFPNCINYIFTLSDEMVGEICHIRAQSPNGARYDPTQTEAERHSFENLILFCRNHHKIVDDKPETFSVEWLTKTKKDHERNGNIELTQNDVRLAHRLLDSYNASQSITQVAVGNKNIQVAGDYHHYEKPPIQNIIVTPPEGAVSPAELKQIDTWIENLAENTIDKPRPTAFGMWRNRFKYRFRLTKSEQFLSVQMLDAESWYRQQLAILKRGLKSKDPDAWRKERYAAIHMAMQQMGVDKLIYYAEISIRLKMKKPFTSLTKLTKRDLERVYTMVLRDARGG
jgi:hypothetical protein